MNQELATKQDTQEIKRDLQEFMKAVKHDFQEVLKLVRTQQDIADSRYSEFRSLVTVVEDMRSKMVTKDQFQSAFMALSEDMAAFSSDHGKLNHRVNRLERRVDLLERKGMRPSEK